jgi:hypothetical protein
MKAGWKRLMTESLPCLPQLTNSRLGRERRKPNSSWRCLAARPPPLDDYTFHLEPALRPPVSPVPGSYLSSFVAHAEKSVEGYPDGDQRVHRALVGRPRGPSTGALSWRRFQQCARVMATEVNGL